jgi:hypothetical protein
VSGELQYEAVHFRGMHVMVGFDDDGDLFVNVNTEDGEEGVNNNEGDPQVWVYLNDATLYDPEDFAVAKLEHEQRNE